MQQKVNFKKRLDKLNNIDVYSRYSESNYEFVTEEDEQEVLASIESFTKFNQERKHYD